MSEYLLTRLVSDFLYFCLSGDDSLVFWRLKEILHVFGKETLIRDYSTFSYGSLSISFAENGVSFSFDKESSLFKNSFFLWEKQNET